MNLFLSYCKDHRKTLLAIPVVEGIAGALFYLYDLPAEPFLYISLVCLTLGLLAFALPGFAAYCKQVRRLEQQNSHVDSALELAPLAATRPERNLEETATALLKALQDEERKSRQKRKDTLSYYTLWVHQIKTPLSAMRLILQSEQSPSAEALAQELFKVERYVELVLHYQRLETLSSDLRLETCTVHHIVSQAVKKFAPQFIYKKLSLSLPPFDDQVITDRKWLEFVVEQLISNAVKYTNAGSVSISMEENQVLLIADTGVGIAPEDLPRVFERGFTGQNGRTENTSTGLGLYLSYQVLQKLNTPIAITSQPGEGTQVRLYLHRDNLPVY